MSHDLSTGTAPDPTVAAVERQTLSAAFDPVSTDRPAGRDLLRVDAEREGDEVLLRVSGEVDMLSSPLLREALDEATSSGCRRVVLDATDVQFMGSDGLGVVVGAHKRCVAAGSRLTLVVGTDPVRRLLRITQLEDVLHVVDVGGR